MEALKKIFIALIAAFFVVTLASAQEVHHSINSEEEEMIIRRAKEKVAQMNDYISFMASKKKSTETRKWYKEKALNLFIGKGYDYEENDERKEGVMMEVTSKRRVEPRKIFMRDYFDNVIRLRYSDVEISSTDIPHIKATKLKKIGDNLYECTCQYTQVFRAYKDGRLAYIDTTVKRIKCYVFKEDTEDGAEFIVLLGDVSAIDTK